MRISDRWDEGDAPRGREEGRAGQVGQDPTEARGAGGEAEP